MSFKILTIFALVSFSYIWVDQSYWQNTIAAKPAQGIWGFVFASLAVNAISFSFGTAFGIAFLVLQFRTSEQYFPPTEDSGKKTVYNYWYHESYLY